MAKLAKREQIQYPLLKVLQNTRRRYEAKECHVDEYLNALRHFNDAHLFSATYPTATVRVPVTPNLTPPLA